MTQNATLEDRLAALEKQVREGNAHIGALEQTMIEALGRALTGIATLDRKLGLAETHRSLAAAARLYPKTRTVLFVGRGFFGDNIKYAYLAFCEYARGKDVACTFLTEDADQHAKLTAAGLPCLPPVVADWTPADIRAVLGAKLAVLADYFFMHNWRNPVLHALAQGAKTIQLWHGIPVKGIGMQNISPALAAGNPGAAEILAAAGPFDVFVASAEATRAQWAEQFSFRAYAAIGSPRDDILFREVTDQDLINVDREALAAVEEARCAGRPIILYAPTFREGAGGAWFDKAGIDRLADHCRARDYMFCVNLHPADHGALTQFRARYPGIRFLAPQTDIFPVLKQADVLMTDYSSLMFDFLLLDRPLVFYRPDHGDYAAQPRGLVDERAQNPPGEMVAGAPDLIRAADAAVAARRTPDKDPFREARHELRDRFFDLGDGRAGERLGALILRQLEEP